MVRSIRAMGRLATVAGLAGVAGMAATVLQEWRFDQPGESHGWHAKVNHVSGVQVQDGALQGRLDDWDPWLTSPLFDLAATPWQAVEFRLKTDCGGGGELFWTRTTESPYGGFMPDKRTPFQVHGDGEWHTYRITPFWQSEDRIVLLRLDFPRPAEADYGRRTFAIEWIRIVELPLPPRLAGSAAWEFGGGQAGWSALGASRTATPPGAWELVGEAGQRLEVSGPEVQFSAEAAGDWLVVEMAVDGGNSAVFSWAGANCRGRCSRTFAIKADGEFHLYNVDLSGVAGWSGDVMMLALQPSDSPGASVQLRRLAVSPEPQGPPVVEVRYADLENAINRAGRPLPMVVTVANSGGGTASGLRVAELRLPPGVRLLTPTEGLVFPEVACLDTGTLRVHVQADRPVSGEFSLRLEGLGAPAAAHVGRLAIDPDPGLPKAEYVPVPQPVECDYEIGALYFPGWASIDRWEPIWRHAPERKPVLGWYDEGNPECVDWQIKWAVENGIQYFLVDWYWSKGAQHLDHWVKAYQKARYRSYLKWAMMWANHNQPGSHSEEDQRQVTRFWIDHYFGMPEYYRIDDMPVVMIWSPANMNRDLEGKGGVARLLQISREMAQAAGYKGIWFVAMKWPEASTAAKDIQWLADAGFNMTSIYHYMHHGGQAENPKRFHFDLVAESSYPFWKARHETGILPFLPNLSTGWDSRPWHGDKATVIHDRTVAHFRRICADAKRFADETGVRNLVLAPLNEWGEGSYAEPCKEHGFGMYEAVRDTFARRPETGWPLNVAPADVGLGPYDLAMPEDLARDSWDFADGAQGWAPLMGIADFVAEDGAIRFTCAHGDPALRTVLSRLRADRYKAVMVRLKAEGADGDPGALQLFWSTTTQEVQEVTSARVPFRADGQFQDCLLPVAENRRWRGRLTSFRLDPGSASGLRVVIDSIRMVPVD